MTTSVHAAVMALGIAALVMAWTMYRTPAMSMMLSATAFCG